ncbi:MAG TPA: 4-hydroxy-tetrahydrodipicolinate synthase [Dehalococcoidia bacterium]|nr:4-hydroxy-tetrahydrodipicolinate synthase [Dehalococcoidia bacterium]
MPEIGRVVTAMVTPFRDDGDLNPGAIAEIAGALLDSGTESLVLAGATGEGAALSGSEKLQLFRATREAVGERAALVACTGTYNTRESIELTREAEAYADGFLLTVPYYSKPTQEGLYQHFAAIAAATSKPCLLYNIPSRSVVNMTAETTIRLSQVPNIAGIKEASGDLSQIAAIIAGAADGFRVWSGNDEDTFGVMSLGGYGVIGVITHLVGCQVGQMCDLVRGGRLPQAAEIHNRLLPLRHAMFSVTSPIPIKWALRRLGLPVGPLRLPLVDPEPAAAEKVWAEVEKHSIDLKLPTAVAG